MRLRIIGDLSSELQQRLAEQDLSLVETPEEAEAIIVSHGGSPQQLLTELSAAEQVGWVQLPSAGIERFADSLNAYGHLLWTSAKGAYALPVGEHALALTLALLRHLPTRARARSWGPELGTSLHGLRAVVAGAGGVALETIRLLKCFDTHVTVVRRHADPVPSADATITSAQLPGALEDADVVVLAAALTDDTRRMIDSDALRRLPEHAILVNVGRGGLVDTAALVTALQQEQIAGAALDVTDPEPLPEGHPLWDEPRALITPHSADTSEMVRPLLAERVAENIRRFRAGQELLGRVDPASGY